MSNEPHPSNDETPGGSSSRGKAGADRGNLIVVAAPSGAGKSSLVDRALSRDERLRYSISCTTRQARGTEQHGVDYYFISEQEFRAMCDRDEFLEFAEVHGCLYGTPKAMIEQALGEGFDIILDIDVQGAEQICRLMPEAVTVFVLPPSREVLESRLRMRNLNAAADLDRRLRNAASEVLLYDRFKYVIVNDDLERASADLRVIINGERLRSERQRHRAQLIIATFEGDTFHA